MWFFWLITFLCTIVGGLQFASVLLLSTAAPQQAAGAAMALCWAILPYVATRCLEGEVTARWRKDVLKALAALAADKTAASSPPPSPAPPPRAARPAGPLDEKGKCPKCGTLRYQSEPVCSRCGSNRPVEF